MTSQTGFKRNEATVGFSEKIDAGRHEKKT